MKKPRWLTVEELDVIDFLASRALLTAAWLRVHLPPVADTRIKVDIRDLVGALTIANLITELNQHPFTDWKLNHQTLGNRLRYHRLGELGSPFDGDRPPFNKNQRTRLELDSRSGAADQIRAVLSGDPDGWRAFFELGPLTQPELNIALRKGRHSPLGEHQIGSIGLFANMIADVTESFPDWSSTMPEHGSWFQDYFSSRSTTALRIRNSPLIWHLTGYRNEIYVDYTANTGRDPLTGSRQTNLRFRGQYDIKRELRGISGLPIGFAEAFLRQTRAFAGSGPFVPAGVKVDYAKAGTVGSGQTPLQAAFNVGDQYLDIIVRCAYQETDAFGAPPMPREFLDVLRTSVLLLAPAICNPLLVKEVCSVVFRLVDTDVDVLEAFRAGKPWVYMAKDYGFLPEVTSADERPTNGYFSCFSMRQRIVELSTKVPGLGRREAHFFWEGVNMYSGGPIPGGSIDQFLADHAPHAAATGQDPITTKQNQARYLYGSFRSGAALGYRFEGLNRFLGASPAAARNEIEIVRMYVGHARQFLETLTPNAEVLEAALELPEAEADRTALEAVETEFRTTNPGVSFSAQGGSQIPDL